jgi:hypothetical protein
VEAMLRTEQPSVDCSNNRVLWRDDDACWYRIAHDSGSPFEGIPGCLGLNEEKMNFTYQTEDYG